MTSNLTLQLWQPLLQTPLAVHVLRHPLEVAASLQARNTFPIPVGLALWELYRRGFDSHHIFSVDEYYWEDRPAYYRALDAVRDDGGDLTGWLEYCAQGLRDTLDRVWTRVQSYQVKSPGKLVLRPRQEQLLRLLRDHGSMAPSELWGALRISKQGAMDLLRPLISAGLVEKIGTKKTGRYALKNA
jgi:Fic family protein